MSRKHRRFIREVGVEELGKIYTGWKMRSSRMPDYWFYYRDPVTNKVTRIYDPPNPFFSNKSGKVKVTLCVQQNSPHERCNYT